MSEQPSGPIDVLLVVDDDVFDRLGSVVRHLCVGMVDEPVRVTVLNRSARQRVDDAVGLSRVVRVPRTLLPWQRWSAGELLEELELEPPQIVHCFSADLAGWVRKWCAEWGSDMVVELTDLHDVRHFVGLELPRDTMAIAITPGVEAALLHMQPELHDSVRVVPAGIPAQQQPACFDGPERVPTVVITARLTRDCGLEHVFKSLRTILQAGQDVQLFLLGTGPAESTFRRQADQLGLRAHVTFAGQMRDWTVLDEAMADADFFILPSASRRFSITRLAAMANGLAVLAPTGTLENYLIDGQTASLFDPTDPRQLTEKWSALLQDHAAARQLAQQSLDYVRTHHQASTMVTATAFLYREMCGLIPKSH